MTRVIVSGDDFGVSPQVNAGILRAHREGVLRGTSLMVAEPWAEAAAQAARAWPGLDVGLHLVVCLGRSVLGHQRLAGIVGAQGEFPRNPAVAGLRYFFDRKIRGALRDEIRAQIERHLKLVGYLNHIDGHLNFHVHPVLADIMVELAAEYRVPCIRIPREPIMTTLSIARDHASRKIVESIIFRALSRRTRRMVAARGIRTTDWLFGLHQTGFMSERYLTNIIARLPAGTGEIYFHPADDSGGAAPPDRRHETELLTSAAIRNAFDRAGVQLINFAELAHGSQMARA
ncbi:MAG: hopanoid biosynthesis-associated protein HpnK [Candidatus Binataceae bacterium]|nr:hopanoid biosynthesis-associated protein HpnK [Candidatus Binataceae bacterium]